MEFWNLCQDYWELEDTDEFWEEVVGKCNDFIEKYGGSLFARGLCGALIGHLEETKKGM